MFALRKFGRTAVALVAAVLLSQTAMAIPPMTVTVSDAYASPGAPVLLTATVTGIPPGVTPGTPGGEPIPGMPVEFSVNGGPFIPSPAPTDPTGKAYLLVAAPALPGPYPVMARLVPIPPVFGVGALFVANPCRVMACDRVCGPDDTVNLLAYLWQVGSYTGIAGKPVYFRYNGGAWQGPVNTDAGGKAQLAITAPHDPGVTGFDVKFDGDATYAGGGASATVTVRSTRSSAVIAYNKTADPGTTITLPAFAYWIMQNQQAVPISGGHLQFHMYGFGAIWQQAVTDATGKAVTSFAVPATAAGPYLYAPEFLNSKNALYDDSWAERTITVRAGTTLAAPARTAGRGDIVEVFGYLKDGGSNPISGKVLQIRVNGGPWTATAATNAVGKGAITYQITEGVGVYTTDVKFEGDGTTMPCATTSSLTVNQKAVTYTLSGDKSGAVGSTVALPGWVYRSSTSAPLAGKPLNFYVDGTKVNASPVVTNAAGHSDYNYVVAVSAGPHVLTAKFEDPSDPDFLPSTSPDKTLTVTGSP
ncbi:MAG: hypothetical protein NT029_19030 [Armatimonadetes bacterium]|nr:hypothetical protein [Armatimonadota bacterium]